MITSDLFVVSSFPAPNADVIDFVIDGPHGRRSISVSGLEYVLSGHGTLEGVAFAKYIHDTGPFPFHKVGTTMLHSPSPRNDDQGIEQEIVARGLTAPRVTLPAIADVIRGEQYHVFDGTTLTVCVLTLNNGFHVVGESACASPDNFDAGIGRRIARESAVQKIWPLLGYELRTRLVAEQAGC
jgi:hypothetical protein